MAKEWILNSAMNRFQLNFKRNVGPTSESIRKCSPKTLDEWREYYFSKVKSKEHIIDLGKKLYVKITEVIQSEVADVTEQDCIDYINNRGHDNIHWGELGVNLISRMIFRNNLGKYIKDPNFFCPISVYQLNILINESDYLLSNTSYAIHWWNEIWRVKKLDKAKTYHSKSFYEILKQKYCVIGKPINKNQETTQNLFQ